MQSPKPCILALHLNPSGQPPGVTSCHAPRCSTVSSCRRPCRGLHSRGRVSRRRKAVSPPVFQTIGPGARRPAWVQIPALPRGASRRPDSPARQMGGVPGSASTGGSRRGRPTEQAGEHPARRGSLASACGRRCCKSVTTARTTMLCARRAPAASPAARLLCTRSPDPRSAPEAGVSSPVVPLGTPRRGGGRAAAPCLSCRGM